MEQVCVLFLLFVVAVAQCGPVLSKETITTWEQFKAEFGKTYASAEEENVRKANFYKSLAYIEQNSGKNGVSLGINALSDWSEEDFYALNSASPFPEPTATRSPSISLYEALPKSWDWRDHLTFNSIENQGHCSSCWAMAAATTVEAAYAHQKNLHNLHLSRQELVDCTNHTFDSNYLNYGCRGGWPTEAYRYMMDHGVFEDRFYHYTGKFNEVCYAAKVAQEKAAKKYFIYNYGRLTYNDTDEAIMSALKEYGPGTVDIHATSETFRNYRSGIMRNVMPNSAITNHIVVVVGWGTEKTQSESIDFWIIRNSWGDRWGEGGYGRLERHHNLLGFNNKYNYPILN